MEVEGTLKLEDYKISSVLAESRASTVYKVKLVAEPYTIFVMKKIKTEDPEIEARAKKELNHLREFSHPHLVHLQAWRDGPAPSGDKEINLLLDFYPYVVPQIVYAGPGFPSCSFEDRNVPVKILRQCADALMYIHSRGYRHGDVRPGHILLTSEYNAVVTDYESIHPLSKSIANEEDAKGVTDPMYEKDPYRAPEIYQPQVGMVIDGKADVWSFGCVIYYCLFSKSPFKEGQHGVHVDNILAGKYVIPHGHNWPASYMDTMARCLTVNLDSRLTMAELQERLQSWEAPPPADAAPAQSTSPPKGTGAAPSKKGEGDKSLCVIN